MVSGLSKLLDDRGKLFGLINPWDLAVLTILMVLGIKVISDYRPGPLKLRENPVTYGLLVRDVPPYLAESITVGQDLFLDQHHIYLGKILTKKIQPAEILINAGDRVLATTSPRNFDLRLELKKDGRIIAGPSRSGVYFGNFPLRVGERLKVHTMYASISGEVEYLRIKGKADE